MSPTSDIDAAPPAFQDCCDASDEGGQGQGGCSKELAEVSERITALLVTEQRGQALKEEMLEMGGYGRV